MAVQYKRILLKVSGEALSGEKGTGFDEATIASICAGIKAAYDLGAQIGIVVGGGVSKHAKKFLPQLTLNTPIVPAALRNAAGIVGAAWLAADRAQQA